MKYGHPTLTKGGKGRIGGELRWNETTQLWEVNKSSGRYSAHPDRGDPQLQHAIDKLNQSGVNSTKQPPSK